MSFNSVLLDWLGSIEMSDTITLPEDWQTLSCSKVPELKVWITSGDKVLTSHKKDLLEATNVGAEIAGVEGKEFQNHAAPFVFGKIATTSEASRPKSTESLSKVGTIKVVYRKLKNVRQVRVTKAEREEAEQDIDSDSDEEDYKKKNKVEPIDEKAKKAQFGLSATLGQRRAVESSKGSKGVDGKKWKYDKEDKPSLTWTFRIRSAISLQDEVLPDEPVASTSKRRIDSVSPDDNDDLDDLSDLDEAELDARLKAFEEKAARIRAKRAKSAFEKKPRVTPPPPYDWKGRPPIDMGKRVYVDFDEDEARKKEAEEKEKDAKEAAEKKKNMVELN
ncbi:uncharacterized protein JCM6883_002855 [Sporobolomyces salmoneus]|uniref:uncharacterized protein n=1 Tax=Sporobolomyces salmoneus TaxID=183962 RepID=UPI003170F24E